MRDREREMRVYESALSAQCGGGIKGCSQHHGPAVRRGTGPPPQHQGTLRWVTGRRRPAGSDTGSAQGQGEVRRDRSAEAGGDDVLRDGESRAAVRERKVSSQGMNTRCRGGDVQRSGTGR